MKILAIDIGGTAIKYGTVLGDYTIEQAFEIPTEAHLGGPHLMNKIMGIVDARLYFPSLMKVMPHAGHR